jgi:UDP-glucose 4-epimerase
MKIAVTGVTGFLGGILLSELSKTYSDGDVVPVLRKQQAELNNFDCLVVDGIGPLTNWTNKLDGIDCVIHCAARVHVMNEANENPLEAFREVNVQGTLALASASAKSGVKRFIFVSSIKVNGESTTGISPFKSSDEPAPEDPYGITKAEAETQLLSLGKETGMEIVIIRPPLVYGEGVKANFASLMKLVKKGLPLPFRWINKNKRSLVSVYNLCDLILLCIEHPKATNNVFLVSDDNDISTAEMVALMSKVQNKTNLSLPIPLWLYKLVGKILSKEDVIDKLTGSLQLDIAHTKNTLDWKPPYSVEHGFKLAAKLD